MTVPGWALTVERLGNDMRVSLGLLATAVGRVGIHLYNNTQPPGKKLSPALADMLAGGLVALSYGDVASEWLEHETNMVKDVVGNALFAETGRESKKISDYLDSDNKLIAGPMKTAVHLFRLRMVANAAFVVPSVVKAGVDHAWAMRGADAETGLKKLIGDDLNRVPLTLLGYIFKGGAWLEETFDIPTSFLFKMIQLSQEQEVNWKPISAPRIGGLYDFAMKECDCRAVPHDERDAVMPTMEKIAHALNERKMDVAALFYLFGNDKAELIGADGKADPAKIEAFNAEIDRVLEKGLQGIGEEKRAELEASGESKKKVTFKHVDATYAHFWDKAYDINHGIQSWVTKLFRGGKAPDWRGSVNRGEHTLSGSPMPGDSNSRMPRGA